MDKKKLSIIAIVTFLIGFTSAICLAADTYEGTFASASSVINVTVSSNTTVLAYDTSRVHWNLHPEGTTAIRCVPGLSNGNPSSIIPSASVGEELLGGGYFDSYPITPPQLSLVCTSESGSVVVSVWQDYKY